MGKEEDAIYLIRMAADMSKRYYDKPFVCTYSGGKDSDVVLELCKRAGVPFVVQHSITTVDAPQTMQHIRKVFDQCKKEGIHCEYTQPTYKGKRVNMWLSSCRMCWLSDGGEGTLERVRRFPGVQEKVYQSLFGNA